MLEEQDINYWMIQALELAKQAQKLGEVPIGAVLVQEGRCIGQGFNYRATCQQTLAHAEMLALQQYNQSHKNWRLFPGASLFVTVEPCLMCTGALLWARVDHIYYGCEDPKGAGLRTVLPLIEKGIYDHRFKVVQANTQSQACSSLLSTYFSEVRQKNKTRKKENALSVLASL